MLPKAQVALLPEAGKLKECLGFLGFQWDSLGSNGIPWVPMRFLGFQWDFPWVPMGFLGFEAPFVGLRVQQEQS